MTKSKLQSFHFNLVACHCYHTTGHHWQNTPVINVAARLLLISWQGADHHQSLSINSRTVPYQPDLPDELMRKQLVFTVILSYCFKLFSIILHSIKNMNCSNHLESIRITILTYLGLFDVAPNRLFVIPDECPPRLDHFRCHCSHWLLPSPLHSPGSPSARQRLEYVAVQTDSCLNVASPGQSSWQL